MIGRRTLAALLLVTASCAQFDQAIGLRPRLDRVEVLLRQGEYDQASLQFTKDNSGQDRADVQMKAAIKWMRALDRDHATVYEFDMTQIDKVRVSKHSLTIDGRAVNLENTLVRIKPKMFPPFSPEFEEYLENRIAETQTAYNAIGHAYNENLKLRSERLRQEAEARSERRRALELQGLREAEEIAQRQRAREARQVAERKAQKETEAEGERLTARAREDEMVRLNQVAQAAGYAGYEDTDVLRVINDARRNGNIENYLQTVIGCHQCDRRNSRIRILSVGETMILYRSHTTGPYQYRDAMLMVPKEAGRIYQDGESLDGNFHVFTGMHTYSTAAGSSKTVPVFERVDLPGARGPTKTPLPVAREEHHGIPPEEIARVKEGRRSESARLDALAKAVGHRGYKSTDILSMIFKTRREGTLKDYVGYVIGCNEFSGQRIDGWTPRCAGSGGGVKIMQVLEDVLLYGRGQEGAIFFLTRESGRMYVEGQRLGDGYFVFRQVHSYTTAAGSKKTIPVFERVDIE